ncbi:endonuclease/exonuclease/phosphatase family protein [Agathobacter sp.]
MNKTVKKILKIFGGAVAFVAAGVLILLAVLTVTEFKPDAIEDISVVAGAEETGAKLDVKTIADGDSIKIMTWNTGYGALGETADFFMDGGKSVSSSDKETVQENLAAISAQIAETDPDVVFMQEVDLDSKRSHYINELDTITESLTGYNSSFAENYKTLYVPYPLPTIGKVDCGLATLSKYEVTDCKRISLPCPFGYPMRLCNLKRCLMVSRVPIDDSDKELVLVNLHLEAYDDGEGKAAQTAQLKELLEEEAAKGNYVIAGGDFNQEFSNYDNSAYPIINDEVWTPGEIDTDAFSEGLSFVTDNSTPSCRSLDRPLKGNDASPDKFQYYMIDGFIVSANLSVDSVETLDLGFKNSDHNPIVMEMTLD